MAIKAPAHSVPSAPIDTLDTNAVLVDLQGRIDNSNALEFTDAELLQTLITALVGELTTRAARSVI